MTAAGPPPLRQLYYTSCERGLSGFSGFQFNAVTPGVSTETLHAVEALAGYDPPRPFVESDTPELLALCPVNLCFLPGGPDGRGATVVCVRYVGRDSARRFGNYFAHALHTDDFAAAAGGLLGIDLWDSPVWTSTIAAGTELPPLPGPPPAGPLSAAAVAGFLRGHPYAGQLPVLLAAVCAALADGRPVVVVDATTDRIAHWFAAVGRLLPPPLARRLSFATYLFRPERSRLHLIGSVPQAPPAFGPDDRDAWHVFDFTTGRFPADLPVHSLLRLLDRIGVGSAAAVWSWTREYADGTERELGDWHAPVAAAAAAGGIALTPEDVAAVIDRLAATTAAFPGGATAAAASAGPGPAPGPTPAPDAGTGTGGSTGPSAARGAALARDLYLRHRTLDEEQLAVLSAAAGAGGDLDLHRELEGKLHASRLRAYVAGVPGAVGPVPVTDPVQRERATVLWQRMLDGAEDARPRLRLLLWARGAGLEPAPEVTEGACRALAAQLLAAHSFQSRSPEFEADTAELLDGWPWFRRSLLAELAQSPAGRDRPLHQVFSRFPASLLTEADLAGRPELLEPYWTAAALRDPGRAVRSLVRILEQRGQEFPDAELLHALWPGRRSWTYDEAGEVLRLLPAGRPGRADGPPDAFDTEGARAPAGVPGPDGAAATADGATPAGPATPPGPAGAPGPAGVPAPPGPAGAPVTAASWFDRALHQDIPGEEALADCLRLCRKLSAGDPPDWVAARSLDYAATTLHLARRLREAAEATALAAEFAAPSLTRWAAPRALKRFRLVPALLRQPAEVRAVPRMLRGLDERTRDGYLRALLTAARQRGQAGPVLLSHLAGTALVTDPLPQAHAQLVEDLLVHAADRWRVEDTRRLAERIRPYDPELARELDGRAERRTAAPVRLLRQALRRRPPGDGPGRSRKDRG
ncbi:GTPase-associated protein 1-related protein [Streptomyces sp. NPDC002073]